VLTFVGITIHETCAMRPWNVGIIGGGPGGLMTAFRLQQRVCVPFTTTIFEASGRLGGKILTSGFSHAPVLYEAGAAELYDYSAVGEDPLRELIDELGLRTKPMGGATVLLNDRPIANTDDIREVLGPHTLHALEQFDRCARDWMSPQEFYRSDWNVGDPCQQARDSFQTILSRIPDATARRYVQTLVHSDLATEPHQTNGAYGLQNYLMNDPAYMRLYTIDGGIERLPEALANRIESTVLLRQRVVRVEAATGNKLRVVSERRGETIEQEFDFVVVALPNNLLPAIEWGGQRLAAAMQRHHAHYNYPAHYLRVSVLFEKPFWRDQLRESYFMSDVFGGCCVYDESARNGSDSHGVLGWLIGGEPALTLSAHTDEDLVRMALDSLPRNLQHGRAYFVEGRVHRWLGAVNGLPSGFPTLDMDTRHMPEPIEHPHLMVVGDYLFDSTVNGVLDSADYVTDWLVVEMEEPRRSRSGTSLPPALPERHVLVPSCQTEILALHGR
jgi:protoporphyrinogen oxidase